MPLNRMRTASNRHRVEGEFTGAEITAHGGAPLLAVADRRTGLTKAAAHAMGYDQRCRSVAHSNSSVVRQRVYALALEYEDFNDHNAPKCDVAGEPKIRHRGASLPAVGGAARRRGGQPVYTALVRAAVVAFGGDGAARGAVREVRAGAPGSAKARASGLRRHQHPAARGAGWAPLTITPGICHLPLNVCARWHLLAAIMQPSDQDAALLAGRCWPCS